MPRLLCRDPLIVAQGGKAIYLRTPVRSLVMNPTPERDAALILDDEMAFELEWIDGLTFAHCDFRAPWSPALRRRSLLRLQEQFALHGGPLYATTPAPHAGDYAKHRKFLTHLCGFRYLQMLPVDGGREQPVYLWSP